MLQGHKPGSVNSRTASIKLILCSHFMSKTAGASEILQEVCVLVVITLLLVSVRSLSDLYEQN